MQHAKFDTIVVDFGFVKTCVWHGLKWNFTGSLKSEIVIFGFCLDFGSVLKVFADED